MSFLSLSSGRRVCWNVRSEGSGTKGVNFQISSDGDALEDVLVLHTKEEDVGWVGAGRARVCVESWKLLDQGQIYTFEVQGTSALFGTSAIASHSFIVSSPPSSGHLITNSSTGSSSCQSSSCDPSLWDASPSSLYGIQTYPSGNTVFPSLLREYPLTITTKALSPCSQIGMAKDILAPSVLSWVFTGLIPAGLVDVNPNDWANGTRLVIPRDVLEDRKAFPPNELVRIRVSADFGNEDGFVADVGIEFVASPVEMVVNPSFETIFDGDEEFVIDFKDSYTLDGITLEDDGYGWIWEWGWSCVIPGTRNEEGMECVYEDGDVLMMPGESEWRFEGEEGKTFEKGVPLFFSVRSRIRQGIGGEVVAEGRWTSIVNPVGKEAAGLELAKDSWVCSDSSVGFLVLFLLF